MGLRYCSIKSTLEYLALRCFFYLAGAAPYETELLMLAN